MWCACQLPRGGTGLDPASWCVGALFIRLKRLFFLTHKMSAMDVLLSSLYNRVPVQDGGMQELVINRVKAQKARELLETVDLSTADAVTPGASAVR